MRLIKHPLTVLTPLILLPMAELPAAEAARPNIVILYADDMGFGDLGANNPQSKIPTPQLDRMAAQGMNFSDAHASSGICTPSRYALLTGRHHWRDFHGIVGAFGRPVFKEDQLTLAQMLRESGYTTASIGKWHLGWDWDAIRKPGTDPKSVEHADFDWTLPVPGGPLSIGFDSYFGDDVINFPPYAWIENDTVVQAPDTALDEALWKPIKEGFWECRKGPMVSGWDPYAVLPTLTQRSVDTIHSRKGQAQPFFLYMAFPSPHAPIIPNDEFDGKSQAGAYGDFVHETDKACGRILKALEDSGLAENTIVIFSADNGAENYALARDASFDHWSSAPFRGRKRDIYEGGHHVPLIVRWPGVIEPGSVSHSLISQTDFMATLAAVVGYELPRAAAEDSFDFLPYLRGETPTAPRPAMVHNTNKDLYALRDGDWVLINAPTGYTSKPAPDAWYQKHNYPADDDLPFELYNLKADPGQRHNLAAQHPPRAQQMQLLLKLLREQGHSAPRLEKSAAVPLLAAGCANLSESAAAARIERPVEVVTYESFGAVGDGVSDDLPAIVAAHAFANEKGLPVGGRPDASYHLGRSALTAIIQTDTDWGTSRFIIDDSQGVEDHKLPLFEVRSRFEPVELTIARLARGQQRLELRPEQDLLVRVENNQRRIFIRRGLNQNPGTVQAEVFILRRDGTIEGGIDWDYETVSKVEALPIDPQPLVLRGGTFIHIANQMRQEVGYNYWSRNIQINRSNTEVDGLTLQVSGETEVGHPYSGFLSAQSCANITFRNCTVNGRKVYQTIGNAGLPVSMGTYGYSAKNVVNFSLIGCRNGNDIHDTSRWGVMGTNFMKNFLIEDCELSRVDVHMGVSGHMIIRRSKLGWQGIKVIGCGQLIIEDCEVHSDHLVSLRPDYGSTWQGEFLIRNSRWIPSQSGSAAPVMFQADNDGTHDFGYPCSMPARIVIDGLFVDDAAHQENPDGIALFPDSILPAVANPPHPYRLTGQVEIRGLQTSSGRPVHVSPNPAVAEAIRVSFPE